MLDICNFWRYWPISLLYQHAAYSCEPVLTPAKAYWVQTKAGLTQVRAGARADMTVKNANTFMMSIYG